MTLHEIEETLHNLQSRHDGLNESTLVTLLRSGGWEEKNIQEAILLFRSGGSVSSISASENGTVSAVNGVSLPPIQEGPVFIPPADENHLLLEHNEELHDEMPPQDLGVIVQGPSPQSYMPPHVESAHSEKDELPHNLPLRPFETSEHIWPFSRYRAVFFGDGERKETKPAESVTAQGNETVVPQIDIMKEQPNYPIEVKVEKKEEIRPPLIERQLVTQKEIMPVPLTKGDEKLVLIAAVMLVAILILLGYMYSNGRL